MSRVLKNKFSGKNFATANKMICMISLCFNNGDYTMKYGVIL